MEWIGGRETKREKLLLQRTIRQKFGLGTRGLELLQPALARGPSPEMPQRRITGDAKLQAKLPLDKARHDSKTSSRWDLK